MDEDYREEKLPKALIENFLKKKYDGKEIRITGASPDGKKLICDKEIEASRLQESDKRDSKKRSSKDNRQSFKSNRTSIKRSTYK